MQTQSPKYEVSSVVKQGTHKAAIQSKLSVKTTGQLCKVSIEASIPIKPNPKQTQYKKSQQKQSELELEVIVEQDPKMKQQQQEHYQKKQQYYSTKYYQYENGGRQQRKPEYWTYNIGKRNLQQNVGFLNHLVCRQDQGEICELCNKNDDPKMKWLYVIQSGGQIHFIHQFCVYNSSGFIANQLEHRILNFEEVMKDVSDKICSLCSKPNASLKCEGKDNQPCKNNINYHAHCLYQREQLGEVRQTNEDGVTIHCSKCKEHKRKPTKEILDIDSKPITKLTKTNETQTTGQVNKVHQSAINRVLLQQKTQLNQVKTDEHYVQFAYMTELTQGFGLDIVKCLHPKIVKIFQFE